MADLRKLKDKAAELAAKGKVEKAADVYREVVEADVEVHAQAVGAHAPDEQVGVVFVAHGGIERPPDADMVGLVDGDTVSCSDLHCIGFQSHRI